MKPFQATHHLISRSRQIPVCLVRKGDVFAVFAEQEWEKQVLLLLSSIPSLGFFVEA